MGWSWAWAPGPAHVRFGSWIQRLSWIRIKRFTIQTGRGRGRGGTFAYYSNQIWSQRNNLQKIGISTNRCRIIQMDLLGSWKGSIGCVQTVRNGLISARIFNFYFVCSPNAEHSIEHYSCCCSVMHFRLEPHWVLLADLLGALSGMTDRELSIMAIVNWLLLFCAAPCASQVEDALEQL